MNPTLPPLITIVSAWHWSVWVLSLLLVIAAIVIEGLWRYNRDENKGSNKDNPIVKSKATEQGQSLAVGSNYGSIIQQMNTGRPNETKTPRIINLPTEIIIDEGQSVSEKVSSPDSDVVCWCILDSIEVNGEVSESLKRHLTSKSSLISWSQGSDGGKKHIVFGNNELLNIATLTISGLQFNMQSGDLHTENSQDYGSGKYKVNLTLRGKVGDIDIPPKQFSASFNCWYKQTQELPEELRDLSEGTDYIHREALTVLPGEVTRGTGHHLYIRIIREDNK